MKRIIWKNKLLNLITAIKETLILMKDSYQTPCRVDEIDMIERKVIIFWHGTRTIIKSTIPQVIFDQAIILNLPPIQACCLGYYYGRLYKNVDNNLNFSNKKNMEFLLRFRRGRFKIVSLERDGSLTYLDIKTKKHYTKNPINIIQHQFTITQFDPSQACYIGILVGIKSIKEDHPDKAFKSSQPILRIVE